MRVSRLTIGACLVLAAALLGACAGGAGEREAAATPDGLAGVVLHQVEDERVAQLWDQAEAARAAGAHADAVALLAEAHALTPGDPVILSRLAEMQLHAGDNGLAEDSAVRSNALAADRPVLRYRNWVIIAEARSRRGDSEGMQAAQRQVERLRPGEH